MLSECVILVGVYIKCLINININFMNGKKGKQYNGK